MGGGGGGGDWDMFPPRPKEQCFSLCNVISAEAVKEMLCVV